MLKKSKQILDNKMFIAQCPHMMNQSALRKQLPAVSLYVVHVLFESKVGTLADQLNVICFSNISIISDSYLSNKFGIMSGTLFSLMDSGAVLSRYDDGTEYKGMSAFGLVDHFRRLDEDPTSPNPSSSSSLILPI